MTNYHWNLFYAVFIPFFFSFIHSFIHSFIFLQFLSLPIYLFVPPPPRAYVSSLHSTVVFSAVVIDWRPLDSWSNSARVLNVCHFFACRHRWPGPWGRRRSPSGEMVSPCTPSPRAILSCHKGLGKQNRSQERWERKRKEADATFVRLLLGLKYFRTKIFGDGGLVGKEISLKNLKKNTVKDLKEQNGRRIQFF